MLKIAICEDDQEQNELLKRYITEELQEKKCFRIYQYKDGASLLAQMQEEFSIILLDVQMDGMNGFEVAHKIRVQNEKVIIMFITGLRDQWDKGYEVKAFRYLIKPINQETFIQHFNDALKELHKQNQKILIRSRQGTIYMPIEELVYLEIEGRAVVIHTLSDQYHSNEKMAYWESLLAGQGFSKPHNSFLVNLNYVKYFCKEYVLLQNDSKIQVSQRKYREFRAEMLNYAGGLV